jgi:hypothetical protein
MYVMTAYNFYAAAVIIRGSLIVVIFSSYKDSADYMRCISPGYGKVQMAKSILLAEKNLLICGPLT